MKWNTDARIVVGRAGAFRRFAFLPKHCDDGKTVWLGWYWQVYWWNASYMPPSQWPQDGRWSCDWRKQKVASSAASARSQMQAVAHRINTGALV